MRNFLIRIFLMAGLCGPLWIAPVMAQSEPDNADPELTAKLVQTATLIQAREQDVLDSETRLDEMKLRRRSQLARFDAQRGDLSQILAAMQRLGRQPPALLLARADAAITHVRGATLLGTVIKGVEQEAAVLREDLAEIDQLEAVMTEEHDQHLTRLEELQEEQKSLADLLVEQRGQQTALIEMAAAKADAMATLAKNAKDAGDLLTRLEKQPMPKSNRAASRAPGRHWPSRAFPQKKTRKRRNMRCFPPRRRPSLKRHVPCFSVRPGAYWRCPPGARLSPILAPEIIQAPPAGE